MILAGATRRTFRDHGDPAGSDPSTMCLTASAITPPVKCPAKCQVRSVRMSSIGKGAIYPPGRRSACHIILSCIASAQRTGAVPRQAEVVPRRYARATIPSPLPRKQLSFAFAFGFGHIGGGHFGSGHVSAGHLMDLHIHRAKRADGQAHPPLTLPQTALRPNSSCSPSVRMPTDGFPDDKIALG